ncbi:MAG: LiaF-related protein [Longimicrobiales bacterium]
MRDRRFSGITLLFLAFLFWLPRAGIAQDWRTVTISRQHSGESDMRVRVRYGAGRLDIRAADPGSLYRMELRYDEETFEPVAEYEGDRLELGVRSIRKNINWPRRKDSGEMNLRLARNVPMDLDLEFGAVRADLDLGGLYLTRLDLSTGASESRVDISEPNPIRMGSAGFEVGAADFHVRNLGNLNAETITVDAGVGNVVLDFRGRWQGDAAVSVDMGLGSLELRFPEGLGVRVMKNTFLTSLDSEGLVKRGDSYYSMDWEEAENRVTVTVDAVFGSIDVVWIR